MPTKYPAQIDNSLSLPNVTDNLTPVQAKHVNVLKDAIISIQSELGVKPSGVSSTVRNRLTNLEIAINSLNAISISGDVGGTASNLKVIGIQGRSVIDSNPIDGYALVWNDSLSAWQPSLIESGGGSSVLPSNANPSSLGTLNSGVNNLYSRSDHVHSHGDLTGATLHNLASGATHGFMSSTDFAKLALINASNSVGLALGTASAGVSNSYARTDHVHPHGDLSGGTLHALASGGAHGFISSTDFVKLASIPTPANILTTSSTFSGDLAQTSSNILVKSISGQTSVLTYNNTVEQIVLNGTSTIPKGLDIRISTSITASANTTVLTMPLLSSLSQRFDVSIVITSTDKTKIAVFDSTKLITYNTGTYTLRNHANISDVADDADAFGLTYTIDISTSNIRIRINTATSNLTANIFASLRTSNA